MVDLNRLGVVISGVEKGFLLVAPCLLIVGSYFASLRWQLLLSGFHLRSKIQRLYAYYLIGSFYGLVLPGVIGGDVVRIGMCSRETRGPVSIITTSVLIERFMGLVTLFVMGSVVVLGFPLHVASLAGKSTLTAVPVITSVTIIVLAAAYLLNKRFPPAKGVEPRARGIVGRLGSTMSQLRQLPFSMLAKVGALSALYQLSDIVASFALAKALNLPVSLTILLAIKPIVYVSTVLPISLGGLGVREATFVYFLSSVGISPSDAVSLSFLIYSNRIVLGLIGGTTHLFWKRSRQEKASMVMT